MGKKILQTIHLRKFGYDVRVLRASVHSLGVMEGNQVSARRGEEYVINRAMYLCNLRFSNLRSGAIFSYILSNGYRKTFRFALPAGMLFLKRNE